MREPQEQKSPPRLSVSLERGLACLEAYVQTLSEVPGVYRMLGPQNEVLYVGKSRSLRTRVQSYTKAERLPLRLQRMVSETYGMEFVTTHTEVEALLLEANLIKKLRPRYNILLKDDKFFAYLALTQHPYPRLMKYRGTRNTTDQYFGPFASTHAVNHSLSTLHKLFKLRSCTDTFFSRRQRPCLEYHIKRCSAPCVGKISEKEYQKNTQRAAAFLKGKSGDVQAALSQEMEKAAQDLRYEHAAVLRDQIQALTALQHQQTVHSAPFRDADVFALVQEGGLVCIQVFFYRSGHHYGSAALFPERFNEAALAEDFATFLAVFYADKDPPPEIYLNLSLPRVQDLGDALAQKAGRAVQITVPRKGTKKRVVERALENAQEAIARTLSHKTTQKAHLRDLAAVCGLDKDLARVEVYDNSHIQGTYNVGAMIVADPNGFDKKSYRKFKIRSQKAAGDDYAMMREVLTRRFTGSLEAQKGDNPLPDLILLDGGAGQLSVVAETLQSLKVEIPLLAVAKGPDRHAGREEFYRPGHKAFTLKDQKSLLHFIQRLRDEAHRFAIGAHREQRAKSVTASILDEIPGVGPLRKKALLKHFGSAKAVEAAGREDLKAVKGIQAALAQEIYDFFHGEAR